MTERWSSQAQVFKPDAYAARTYVEPCSMLMVLNPGNIMRVAMAPPFEQMNMCPTSQCCVLAEEVTMLDRDTRHSCAYDGHCEYARLASVGRVKRVSSWVVILRNHRSASKYSCRSAFCHYD